MKISKNPNYIKASNLIFIATILGIINFFLSPDILKSKTALIISVVTILLILAIGVVIRLGISWIKYILLVLIIIGFNSLPKYIKEELSIHPLNAIITILQSILQIYATLLLILNRSKK
ncbi:hypothetical protein GKZ90_0024210 [Flavobacterium sp. MC2016-06]|uniref:hypothetical protein n=1 Tax=Flavobacterium sp. MC2016-06 TaxID=2676308 RepID=UPI0012BA8903|nr:hypothetical protein [Flavobacterium sp. MC2016-06]MBU3861859.1 hypothetical protein [Flavobacterium sp. MC2016-06]